MAIKYGTLGYTAYFVFLFCVRCFGFVTFQDPASVDDVVNSGPHILDDQTVLYRSKAVLFLFL